MRPVRTAFETASGLPPGKPRSRRLLAYCRMLTSARSSLPVNSFVNFASTVSVHPKKLPQKTPAANSHYPQAATLRKDPRPLAFGDVCKIGGRLATPDSHSTRPDFPPPHAKSPITIKW